MMDVRAILLSMEEPQNADLQRKLTPGLPEDSYLGVRVPNLRRLAKDLYKDPACGPFLDSLPHRYFDENMLHAAVLSEIREFDVCVERIRAFLPYVDNWSACDTLLPKCFPKNRDRLPALAWEWMASAHTYTRRFGIGILMRQFLDGDFREDYPKAVAAIESGDYYVDMMVAWYFATALAKQWDAAFPYIRDHVLPEDTERKAVRKALESFRVSPERKDLLRNLQRDRTDGPES